MTKSQGFRFFLGCARAELHDKVVDGVSYRGLCYVVPVFDDVNHEK
jgi:hypothetical protein